MEIINVKLCTESYYKSVTVRAEKWNWNTFDTESFINRNSPGQTKMADRQQPLC